MHTRAKTKRIQSQASMEHQPTHSGHLIGSNDDLLTEILLRLPVTSILRFKSVSKHWQSLLSHRSFTLLYDNLSKSPGMFVGNTYFPFDVENPSPPPFRSLDLLFDIRGIRILQSCNGLLLLCSNIGYNGASKYYVFNPTTKQIATVPGVPGGHNVRKTICFMGLVFHQRDCVHYKVVCIRREVPYGDLFQIQIYSSNTRKWKVSIESFYMNWWHPLEGVYWNGAIHWAPSYHNHLFFKIEDERLQTLPLPVGMTSSETRTTYFGESRGHLHLTMGLDFDAKTLNVHEMLSDHSGWFVKYQVDLLELRSAFPEMINARFDFVVVDVIRGEKEEDTFMLLLLIHSKMIIRYNVHDKSFKQLFNLNATNYIYKKFTNAHHRYTETLASF
ncbi:putative F-box domain-containing protein [Helianthus annuus]|nr:putative F-box domain-containing protein [Helianthus annuus]